MEVTATEAKNHLGQMLEHAQREPVVIAKSGRRHSVLISAQSYDALVQAAAGATRGSAGKRRDPGREFYAEFKEWVDVHNDLVERYGVPCEEYRPW